MPLNHNLLYPKQKAELEKKLDPIKIALLIGLLIMIGVISWYFVQEGRVRRLDAELKSRQAEWGPLEARQKAAEEQRAIDTARLATADAVISSVEERVYFAPVLQVLLEQIPGNVQLTRTEINYAKEQDRLNILLSGKVAGVNETQARGKADDLRLDLREAFREAYFETAEAEWRGSELTPSAPMKFQERTLSTVDFQMEIIVPLAPPPEPAPL